MDILPIVSSLQLPVLELAREAGKTILEIYARSFTIQTKADHSPLTEADLAAHDIIVAGLRSLTPDLPILSEESVDIPWEERAEWTRYWLIDPLDGTREFIKHNGEFTVNIALIDQHQSILGVVYAPVHGLYYFATLHGHAYKQQAGDSPERIQTQAWKKGTPLRVVASRSHRIPELQAFLAQLPDVELAAVGSSLKSCYIAEGKADLYPRFGLTAEWDTAAAQCVLEAAGGVLVDFNGEPLRYNTKRSLLNPSFMACAALLPEWRRLL